MWKCTRCGETNDDNHPQCPKCGNRRPTRPEKTGSKGRGLSGFGFDGDIKPIKPMTPPERGPEPSEDPGSVKKTLKKRKETVKLYKGIILLLTLIQFALFAFNYIKDSKYTIYHACIGDFGAIEQICSILLVILTIAPALTVLIKLDVRKRNLPITIAAIVATLTTVYCLVIWFGNPDSTIVPALIILVSCGIVFVAYRYVKAMNEADNTLLFRPTSF